MRAGITPRHTWERPEACQARLDYRAAGSRDPQARLWKARSSSPCSTSGISPRLLRPTIPASGSCPAAIRCSPTSVRANGACCERKLLAIQARVRRDSKPLRGKDKIALAVGVDLNHYKMAKHFVIAIADSDLTSERNAFLLLSSQ